MTMLLVIVFVAWGLYQILTGNPFGTIAVVLGVLLATRSKGDIVDNLLAGMFGLVVLGGAVLLVTKLLS